VFVVLVQLRVLGGHTAQHLIRHGGEFTGLRIDERELPFHTKS
jgi:hypothetical protein